VLEPGVQRGTGNKKAGLLLSPAFKGLAATYSRASYTGTTIGNAVFDGRVRDGIGSGHRFMATVKCFREQDSLKTAYVGA
jgi:hypothetical protein